MNTKRNKIKRYNWNHPVVQFLKTTTLHGFKYLCSEYYVDRVGWLICCLTSTICAGLLCTVLWARFLQVPALLAMCDIFPNETVIQRTPNIAVCPPPEVVTRYFLEKTDADPELTKRLPQIVPRVLSGKSVAEDQLNLLEELLAAQNMSITDMLFEYMPACKALMVRCRWQDMMLPCELLFEKEITLWGTCCVMRPETAFLRLVNRTKRPTAWFQMSRRLDFVMHCSNESSYGCKFVTKFDGEEDVTPLAMMPGLNYVAQLRFNSVPQNSPNELVISDCISDRSYSRALCLDKCAEVSCGCSDPFRVKNIHEHNLPPCSVTQISCLRAFTIENTTLCKCLPSCDKVITYINLESNHMDIIELSYDPIFSGINASTSTVLFMKVGLGLSRIFTLNPTETWVTLLCEYKASLGGIFNMFLGVGLFSALEILFLLLFKLPLALKRGSEIR